MKQQQYPIGTPGVKWAAEEKQLWLEQQSVKRSYFSEVVTRIEQLADFYQLENYGRLCYQTDEFPLYLLKSLKWSEDKPTVLVTGGVHGYESSGVHGALDFLEHNAANYIDQFNIVVAPCVSPWGYQTINRWNADAVDPNRSFYQGSPAQESIALMAAVKRLAGSILMHIDLHETTDTDNSEFRPALAARDGCTHDNWNIPDGFYVVGDTHNPQPQFQQAVINAVAKVTHIADADANGQLIGAAIQQPGVINYPLSELGLCTGFSGAKFTTTTEVYPDSPRTDPANCNAAQVAAICGALDHLNSLTQC